MAECLLLKGGGSGAGSDDCTSTRNELLKGYTAVTGDSGDEPVEGALELTGNALTNQVLAGATFYSTNAKNKLAGTMAIQSILSFSAAVYSSTAITFAWNNPAKGPFSGVIIVGKTGSYPTSITDGTRYYKGTGNNTIANGTSSTTVSSFAGGTTYYFRAFSYATRDNTEWVHATTYTATAATTKGQQSFTSSGSFTIPANVRSIDLFTVGGGGGGGIWNVSGSNERAGGGGGGGYTKTQKALSVTPGSTIQYVVGAGGPYNINKPGGDSYFIYNGSIICLASGGNHGRDSINSGNGNGGSGGGAGGWIDSSPSNRTAGGNGGSNGGNGLKDSIGGGSIGAGQGTTTRAFGESANTLYAGGGGGGNGGTGGAGGGGRGSSPSVGNALPGGVGTGGGGGGDMGTNYSSANGGSGICILRWGY